MLITCSPLPPPRLQARPAVRSHPQTRTRTPKQHWHPPSPPPPAPTLGLSAEEGGGEDPAFNGDAGTWVRGRTSWCVWQCARAAFFGAYPVLRLVRLPCAAACPLALCCGSSACLVLRQGHVRGGGWWLASGMLPAPQQPAQQGTCDDLLRPLCSRKGFTPHVGAVHALRGEL